MAGTGKHVEWIASSLSDLRDFPAEVRREIGQALSDAERGLKHPAAKPLTGSAFKGAGVLEVVSDFDGDTFRAVYTVRFAGVLYVLDAFQKKSTRGAKTPLVDIDRIVTRLKAAKDHYADNYAGARTKK